MSSVLGWQAKLHVNRCAVRKNEYKFIKKKICSVDNRVVVRIGEENFASRIAQNRKYMSS